MTDRHRDSAQMDLAGKTVLITGSTDGLGRAVALALAQSGATILIHGRNRERGEDVQRQVQERGATARFFQADFASLAEVDRLAREISETCPDVHLLINNAGIGFGRPGQRRQLSADGHELRFAVNYLAPVLLTERLRPLLIHAAPSRIVNVAAAGQAPINFQDLMLEHGYSGARAYKQSKLAMIMWTFELAEELRPHNVTINAVHPASFMNTHRVREGWGIPLSSVQTGVEAVLNLALARGLAGVTGLYFDRLSATDAHEDAYRAEIRARLRQTTAGSLAHLLEIPGASPGLKCASMNAPGR